MASPEAPNPSRGDSPSPAGSRGSRRSLGWLLRAFVLAVAGLGVAGFLLIQLVPYGRDHSNPPVAGAPAWDSPRTEQLARTACMDCHSNQTVWPWYSNVAPMSWLVQHDVDEARSRFNLSEPSKWANRGRPAAFQVQRGTMPLSQYTLIHRDAALSPADRQALAAGLQKSLVAP